MHKRWLQQESKEVICDTNEPIRALNRPNGGQIQSIIAGNIIRYNIRYVDPMHPDARSCYVLCHLSAMLCQLCELTYIIIKSSLLPQVYYQKGE